MSEGWDEMVVVGWIVRPHGLRGHVIVKPETDFPEERFRAGSIVFLGTSAGPRALTVREARGHLGRLLVTFADVGSVEEAEALGRGDLRVESGRLAPLPQQLMAEVHRGHHRNGLQVQHLAAVLANFPHLFLEAAGRFQQIIPLGWQAREAIFITDQANGDTNPFLAHEACSRSLRRTIMASMRARDCSFLSWRASRSACSAPFRSRRD